MDRVANILPFLLLGGFSKAEVISYLKAKLEAAKQVLTGVDAKKEDEDTMVERGEETKAGHAEMAMHEELPGEEKSKELGEMPPGSEKPEFTPLGEERDNNQEENGGNRDDGGMPPPGSPMG